MRRSGVATVLLRMAGLDALYGNAKPQPLDRQLAEAEDGAGAGERDALSVRMARGKPYSLKTRSNTLKA
jgi:hypothetical protein